MEYLGVEKDERIFVGHELRLDPNFNFLGIGIKLIGVIKMYLQNIYKVSASWTRMVLPKTLRRLGL